MVACAKFSETISIAFAMRTFLEKYVKRHFAAQNLVKTEDHAYWKLMDRTHALARLVILEIIVKLARAMDKPALGMVCVQ